MKTIDFHSCTSLPIELWRDEIHLSNATAFFYSKNNQLYLISNWHVFSGRNALTGQPLDKKNGALPNKIKMFLHALPIGNRLGPWWIHLSNDQESKWLQHQRGQEIDIACLLVRELPEHAEAYLPTDNNSEKPLYRRVGGECYIVGFPIVQSLDQLMPIWKRGSVASEYDIGFDNKDCFLVDSTTSSGMSGSPVFLRQSGSVLFDNLEVGLVTGAKTEFVGIYSGRYSRTEDGALSLGFVWKRSLIDEMIDSPVLGSYHIRRLP